MCVTADRMKKIRVLVTCEVLAHAFTGVERYTVELVRALAQNDDIDVSVLCQKAEHADVFPPRVQRRVEHPVAGFGLLGYWLWPPTCLNQYDIVHCPTVRTPFLKRPAGPKLVMTVHDLVPLVTPDYHSLQYRIYYRHVLPRIVQQCDSLIADSESTKDDLQREFKSWRLPDTTVVHAGPRWIDENEQPERSREDFFLSVATLEPRKNLRRVIEAFLALKKEQPNSPDRLALVGKMGWGVSDLQQLIATNRDVIDPLGYVSEEKLQDLYRRAKALVYPSLYEGFGLPVLEAMSLGCPVITSDRSSLPEVAGDAALYVEPENVAEITTAMRQISGDRDLCIDLARRGYARAKQFSWDRCAAETAAVYYRLVDSVRSRVPVLV